VNCVSPVFLATPSASFMTTPKGKSLAWLRQVR
jgi:hypothetical protein